MPQYVWIIHRVERVFGVVQERDILMVVASKQAQAQLDWFLTSGDKVRNSRRAQPFITIEAERHELKP
jgi:hypothetical protein